MNGHEWILLDTETNGLAEPIFAVELAAQRMKGWDRSGPPFRYLLNQNAELSPEASRIHGYTREILERDGEEPQLVYAAFRTYVEDRPLVSYNLAFDYDKVLIPEWERNGLQPAGRRGLCALRLAQRLLDPVPAGNCKLQTLRQYYRLPERGAHTALGDVDTVIDLFQNVLRPIAETRGLLSWDQLRKFADEEWFPSRLAFGKFKGRDFHDARHDRSLHGWLEWLASSANQRTARIGRWYLDELLKPEPAEPDGIAPSPFSRSEEPDEPGKVGPAGEPGIVVYVDRDAATLRALIVLSRARLAEVQAAYMAEKGAVDATSAALFGLVREHYQRRDRLRLIIEYRRKFLDVLLAQGDDEAEDVVDEFQAASEGSEKEYEEAARAASGKTELSDDQKLEIRALWKKLVFSFHPDRYAQEPEKQAIYARLTAAINEARDAGDVAVLRQIADDPEAYIARQGWGTLEISRADETENLRKLYEAIELEIVERIEALTRLRESPEYELMKACRERPEILGRVAEERIRVLEAEIEQLAQEANRLQAEIEELTGEETPIKA